MNQSVEYVAIELPRGTPKKGQRLDDLVTEALNSVAAHGYRYVGAVEVTSLAGTMAIMERPKS